MTTPNNDLRTLAREFRLALEARLTDASMWEYRLPSKDEVAAFCRSYLDALFPLYYAKEEANNPDAAGFLAQLDLQLAEQIVYAMRFDLNCCGKPVPANLSETASHLVAALHAKLPKLAQLLATDLQAALKNDPAASGYEEILLSYPGVTLGAFNPTSRRNGAELVRGLENKRHPDIEDGVTIYPGATILGGDTRVGHHSVIGGNVWLTHSVAPYSRVTVKDPELLIRSKTQDSDKDWFLGSALEA